MLSLGDEEAQARGRARVPRAEKVWAVPGQWSFPLDLPARLLGIDTAGTGGGELELEAIEEPIVKIRLSGPAASVMTVRVAVTQKLREKMPSIAAVQLI